MKKIMEMRREIRTMVTMEIMVMMVAMAVMQEEMEVDVEEEMQGVMEEEMEEDAGEEMEVVVMEEAVEVVEDVEVAEDVGAGAAEEEAVEADAEVDNLKKFISFLYDSLKTFLRVPRYSKNQPNDTLFNSHSYIH